MNTQPASSPAAHIITLSRVRGQPLGFQNATLGEHQKTFPKFTDLSFPPLSPSNIKERVTTKQSKLLSFPVAARLQQSETPTVFKKGIEGEQRWMAFLY